MTIRNQPRLSFERDGSVFYTANDSTFRSILLGLLCHEKSIAACSIRLDHLSVPLATLLLCYSPKRVLANSAETNAIKLLEAEGTVVLADRLDTEVTDEPMIAELCHTMDSPHAFRNELRTRLLSTLQKRREIPDDWVTATPESMLGGGGGGT